MNRKTYWNEKYMDYWRQRVEETEKAGTRSAVISGDAKTEGDEIYEAVFTEYPFRPGRILDVGCAWGRMFPLFVKAGLRVSGVDISDAMIGQCRTTWMEHDQVESIEVAEAEALPYPDDHFDNLVCVAVFDATYQDRALTEFLRTLKPGGRLYLTGKNTRYCEDDRLAIEAEAGARRKGHPNYFTDFAAMRHQLLASGNRIAAEYYFERRGDFAAFRFSTDASAHFYEYFVVIEKGNGRSGLTPFSSDYSVTFKKVAGQ